MALGEVLRAVMGGVQEVQQQNDLDAFANEAARRFSALGTPEGADTAKFVLENPRAAISYMEQMGGMGQWYGALKRDADAKRQGGEVADIMTRPTGYGPKEQTEAQAAVLRAGGNANTVPAPADPDWMQGVTSYTYTPESIAAARASGDPKALVVQPWMAAQGQGGAPKPNAELANLPNGAKYLKLQKQRALVLAKEARAQGIKDEKGIAAFIRNDFEYQELGRQLESERKSSGGITPTQEAKDTEISEAWRFLEGEMNRTSYRDAIGEGQFAALNPKRPEITQALTSAKRKRIGESDEEYQGRMRRIRAWQLGKGGSAAPATSPANPAPPRSSTTPPKPAAPRVDPRSEVQAFNERLRKKKQGAL